MKKNIRHKLADYMIQNYQRQIWRRVVVFLACIVVFCTTYALILPAITLEKNECGMEEHIHTEACYAQVTQDYQKEPVCSVEKLEIHQHTEECYNEKGEFQCGMADFVIHQHDASCFGEDGMLWCPLPEMEAHTHSEACYDGTVEEAVAEEPFSSRQGAEDEGESGKNDVLTGVEEGKTVVESGIEGMAASEKESVTKSGTEESAAPECYVDGRVPACGKDEVIPHEHGEDCYGEDGSLICGLPQVLKHQHDVSCFQDVEKEPDTETLICQMEEHTHGESCLANPAVDIEPEEDDASFAVDALSVSDGTSAVAASSANGEGPEWGYNADGSIWWGTALMQVTDIQENTPYIIAGYAENNLMADVPYEKGGFPYLKAIPKQDVTDYMNYQHWCFEKKEESVYYIYYQKRSEDGSEKKLYLQFAGAGVVEWNKSTQKIILTEEKSQATAFTVEKCTNANYQNHFVVSVTMDGVTYYINSYFGDKPKDNGNTTHWLGYPEYSEGSFLKICERNESTTETARRLQTVVSANTVINLFDYWTNPEGQMANDGAEDFMDSEINHDHNFKFYKYTDNYEKSYKEKWGTMNQLQAQAVINSGIVAKTLENGYPKLSGDQAITKGSTQSLDYLFDPNVEHNGKKSYHKVGGLLRVNEEGYYFFDSRETMAEYKSDENAIVVYDQPGVHRGGSGQTSDFGQFFPLNRAPEIMLAKSTDTVMNHYLGMTITTRFIQRHKGCSDIGGKTPTTFSFAGDDDVWIFIDDVLVADLGGAHASVSVDINFQSGDITIKGSKTTTTTLRDAYRAAGAENKTVWRGDENTYADNTTHTLKFFYLERGNWDSNLYLKYNLTEIPKTAIYKVNQYGEVVPGATFAVYAADEDYHMLGAKGGSRIDVPKEPQYDPNGNMLDSSGNILAKSLYTGTTNDQGEMIFVDADGMPYSLNELEELFGSNFILREIKVPEGYRLVVKDVYLEIWHGENQTILKCDNTTQSGSRAATTLQITATDTLYLQTPYNGSHEVQYCDPGGETFGTLFAVIYKYIGEIDEAGNATGVNQDSNWAPVYGNDKEGYSLVDMKDKSLLAGALEAAVKAQDYGDVVFRISSSSTMQLTLENLPGHITTYYRMLGKEKKGQARYTVAYYWTDQDSLEKATTENIHRVYTFAEAVPGGGKYSGFERVFGANIQVPNLINKVFVQKVDEKDERIDGAVFALYQVQQADDGTIKYRLEGDNYTALPTDAEVAENGVISSKHSNITIAPFKTDITKTYSDTIHVGTAEFSNLPDGQYIIKEVKAPEGYKLNTADVMVLVTEDTIYANAGTVCDGVSVGRGPGYVVSTLNQFASEGQIDNTLSWIYAKMRISQESTSFSDVGNPDMIQGYLKVNNSSEICENQEEAATTYLKYSAEGTEGRAFNYVVNDDHAKTEGAAGTRRLFTTVGWPYYEIHQDYAYGSVKKDPSSNYEKWEGDLAHLFSRSTYIRVRDIQDTTVAIKKVDASNRTIELSGAKFRLYRIAGEKGYKEYYAQEKATESQETECPDISRVSWTQDDAKALVVTTGTDGLATFTGLKDGTYYFEEIKAPDGYLCPSEPVMLTIEKAKATLQKTNPADGLDLEEKLGEDNLYTYTLIVPNSTGYELPETGGVGIQLYTFSGLAMMACALGYYMYRRRRWEKEAS